MANIDLWGVTSTGFYRPTIEDIINEKNKKAKAIFGEDFDTGELTPQGKFFRINAAAESKLCEIAEGIYYSIFPSSATGVSLDRVCKFANLQRESVSYAVHEIKVYGEQGYTVDAGTKFKNTAGVEFYSTMDAVVENEEKDGIYYAIVTVQCTENGVVGNVTNINATSKVNTNIDNVVYQSTLSYGTKNETDPELREKFSIVTQGLGTNTAAAIKANVLRVAGVNDVIIIDNNTDKDIAISDKLTVASGSYAVIVHSDDTTNEKEISAAIFEKQPFGIKQSGIKTVMIKDDAGIEQIVKFSYVEKVDIVVDVKCIIDNTFLSDGIQTIKNNITSYINGLGIGQKVIYSRLYDHIYNTTGVYDVENIKLYVNGVEKTGNIIIPSVNIAKVGNISVTVTEV